MAQECRADVRARPTHRRAPSVAERGPGAFPATHPDAHDDTVVVDPYFQVTLDLVRTHRSAKVHRISATDQRGAYRTACEPGCQTEARNRRKIMRKARSKTKRPILLAELERRYRESP